MRLLLDTCAFLWLISEPDRLGMDSRAAIEDGSNEIVLHQVSALEIQLKYQTGKLELSESPERIVQEGVRLHDLRYQSLTNSEIWFLKKLPPIHRDPFDRLLISCALEHALTITTPDKVIADYPVRTLW